MCVCVCVCVCVWRGGGWGDLSLIIPPEMSIDSMKIPFSNEIVLEKLTVTPIILLLLLTSLSADSFICNSNVFQDRRVSKPVLICIASYRLVPSHCVMKFYCAETPIDATTISNYNNKEAY